MVNWLKRFGRVGETLAWIVALIETKITWGVLFSIALGFVAAIWSWSLEVLSDKRTQTGIAIALVCFWTYVGFRVLRYLKTPIRTQPALDFRYCISPEGLNIGIDPNDDDKAVSFMFTIRNVGNWPIRIALRKFDVRIEDRAVPEPEKEFSVVIPRIGARVIKSAGFKKDVIKDKNYGSVDLVIVYGDPDGMYERMYRFKSKLHFIFKKDETGELKIAAVSEEGQVEEDLPFRD
jgi:hypothetical protein